MDLDKRRTPSPDASDAPDGWLDRAVLTLAYGAVAPVTLFLVGWWGSLPFLTDRRVLAIGGVGLLVGLAVDVPLHRWWRRHGYSAPVGVLAALYGFYAIMIFGVFMGVPVPLLGLGLAAGVFAARSRRDLRATARLSAAWMTLACCGAAAFALASPSTPADLTGMLALPFAMTWTMVGWLIAVGGVLLVAAQYWLTAASGRWWARHAHAA